MRRARESAVVLFKFLDRSSSVGQAVEAEFLPPLSKQLEFDNVTLNEPGTGRKLLNGVSLTVQAGQRVALVGPDDMQKHALVYLMPRFLDPTAGEIRIDRKNLRWVTFDSLAGQHRRGLAAQPRLQRHGGQQHRLRRSQLPAAQDHRGGQGRPLPPVHPEAAAGL